MYQFLFGRRRSRSVRDYFIKALLIGLPITWLVFALEMTVLSVDYQEAAPDDKHVHKLAKDFVSQRTDNEGDGTLIVKDGEVGFNKQKVEAIHQKRENVIKRWNIELAKNQKQDTGGGDGSVDRVGKGLVGVRFDPPKEGEGGQPVHTDPSKLIGEDKERYETGYKNHNFNEFASDLVSIQRTVPDYRPDTCRYNNYNPPGVTLQQVSIIMCFYNEAWSTLLRSVHSVLDRSPPHLLRELILVDDFSDLEHLKSKLDTYMADYPKVKILRMTERVGLVRARLHGVDQAQGPILIFLDSHIECGDGWMEPLVHLVSHNSTLAVTPIIDIIDKDTMAIVQAIESMGVVDLRHMTFIWSRLTPRIQRLRGFENNAFLSPTMAGGLFAINKKFFMQLGTWDPGLQLWGGENLELSFKLWMCGGAILIHPCSRVSHIFRDKSPYLKNSVDRIVKSNSARVAEVWLDNYKGVFFNSEVYDPSTYGDVSDRKQLRHVLACHNFQWYIDNVYPEMFIDGLGVYLGHIQSRQGLCLRLKDSSQQELILSEFCDGATQWQTSRTREIRHYNLCLDQSQGHVFANGCDSQEQNQAFEVHATTDGVTIVHVLTGFCVSAVEAGRMGSAMLSPCLYGDTRQIWHFKKNPLAL